MELSESGRTEVRSANRAEGDLLSCSLHELASWASIESDRLRGLGSSELLVVLSRVNLLYEAGHHGFAAETLLLWNSFHHATLVLLGQVRLVLGPRRMRDNVKVIVANNILLIANLRLECLLEAAEFYFRLRGLHLLNLFSSNDRFIRIL